MSDIVEAPEVRLMPGEFWMSGASIHQVRCMPCREKVFTGCTVTTHIDKETAGIGASALTFLGILAGIMAGYALGRVR